VSSCTFTSTNQRTRTKGVECVENTTNNNFELTRAGDGAGARIVHTGLIRRVPTIQHRTCVLLAEQVKVHVRMELFQFFEEFLIRLGVEVFVAFCA